MANLHSLKTVSYAAIALAVLLCVFFSYRPAEASIATIKKSVTYVAGPFDTEDSAQAIAGEKAKRLILADAQRLLQQSDDVAPLLAVFVQVTAENWRWDGKMYYLEALTVVDTELLGADIENLRSEPDRVEELGLIRKRANDALAEIEELNTRPGDLRDFAARLKRYEVALRALRAVHWTEEGLGALSRGGYPAAVNAFGRASQLNHDDEFAVYNRGVAHWYLENFAQAVEDFKRALHINPEYARARESLKQAELYFEKVEEQVAYYDRLIAVNPDSAGAYTDRGLALWELGKYADAINDFTKVIELEPDVDDGYVNRGGLFMSQGRYDEAISDFEAALKADPESTVSHFNLGLAYIRLGRLDDAASAFTKVIELEPGDAEALFNRGAIEAELGQSERALDDMRRAAELGHKGAISFFGSQGLAAPPSAAAVKNEPVPEAEAAKPEYLDMADEAPEPQEGPSQKYALQAGVFRSLDNADAFSMELKKKGYGSYGMGLAKEGKAVSYVVLVGRYADKDMALATQKQLKDNDNIETVLIRFK